MEKQKRSGKLILVSFENFNRLARCGWYGDHANDIVGRILDVYDAEMARRKASQPAPGSEPLGPR